MRPPGEAAADEAAGTQLELELAAESSHALEAFGLIYRRELGAAIVERLVAAATEIHFERDDNGVLGCAAHEDAHVVVAFRICWHRHAVHCHVFKRAARCHMM